MNWSLHPYTFPQALLVFILLTNIKLLRYSFKMLLRTLKDPDSCTSTSLVAHDVSGLITLMIKWTNWLMTTTYLDL